MTKHTQRALFTAMDRSTKPSFNFVNLQHPDDLKNEETQLRIRRLAMTEVGKARRKPKTKRARHEIVLEFRKPSEQSHTHVDRFGGGQLDPFGPYPVELDDSERALLANGGCVPKLPRLLSDSEQFLPPRITTTLLFCEVLGILLDSVISLLSTTCLPTLKTSCSKSVMDIFLLKTMLLR